MGVGENREGFELRLRELSHLLGAIRTSMEQGGNFLVERLAPNGPIMRERSLEYVHKPI